VVRKLSWLEEAQDEAIMNVPREEVNRWLGEESYRVGAKAALSEDADFV
jgi:hypothetical protein